MEIKGKEEGGRGEEERGRGKGGKSRNTLATICYTIGCMFALLHVQHKIAGLYTT